jgi:hypothetical protein
MSEKNIKSFIDELIKEVEDELDEANVTGNVDGYDTPHAFSGKNSDKKRKKTATQFGYTLVNNDINNIDESVNEAKFKSPDYIISTTPASSLPQQKLGHADVSVGLKMAEKLKNYTLDVRHYNLTHANGKVALKLTQQGKTAVRVRTEDDPKYLQLIQKTVNDVVADYVSKLKESVNEANKSGDKLTHKHNPNIEIELIEPTNKGWKVYQIEKGKKKIAYFDKQDISGDRALFESVNEASLQKGKTYGGSKCEGGCFIGKEGLKKIIKISKDSPKDVFMFRDDNYSGLQPHFIKDGVIARANTINPAYDLEKNKVRSLNIDKDVILSVRLFVSTNESVNEALDPKAEKFLDAIQVNDRSIKDLKNITVDATPQGNWSVYYKGKRMFTLNGKMLDDKTIMKYGLEHMDESLSEGKRIQRPVNRWLELKNDESMHANKKLATGLRELKYQLKEVETFFRWYNQIKTMNELSSDTFWKRTHGHIYKIKERLINIAKTIQEIEK